MESAAQRIHTSQFDNLLHAFGDLGYRIEWSSVAVNANLDLNPSSMSAFNDRSAAARKKR